MIIGFKREKPSFLADQRAADVFKAARIDEDGFKRIDDAPDLSKNNMHHPLAQYGGIFAHKRHIIAGDFVSDEAGTGVVHIAPGHGEDDYGLWLNHRTLFPEEYHKDLPHSVQPDGGYYPNIPRFWQDLEAYKEKNNLYILKPNGKEGNANEALIQALIHVGGLAARSKIKHSYPHSWRSKAPLIFRNTAQWFISMEEKNLRQKALNELEKVNFYPERGRNRITRMIEARPDWVVSRQRAWGVPLALFICKKTGAILNNEQINKKITDIFEAKHLMHGGSARQMIFFLILMLKNMSKSRISWMYGLIRAQRMLLCWRIGRIYPRQQICT